MSFVHQTAVKTVLYHYTKKNPPMIEEEEDFLGPFLTLRRKIKGIGRGNGSFYAGSPQKCKERTNSVITTMYLTSQSYHSYINVCFYNLKD